MARKDFGTNLWLLNMLMRMMHDKKLDESNYCQRTYNWSIAFSKKVSGFLSTYRLPEPIKRDDWTWSKIATGTLRLSRVVAMRGEDPVRDKKVIVEREIQRVLGSVPRDRTVNEQDMISMLKRQLEARNAKYDDVYIESVSYTHLTLPTTPYV